MTSAEQGEGSSSSCCNKLDLLACDDESLSPDHWMAFETCAALAVRQTSLWSLSLVLDSECNHCSVTLSYFRSKLDCCYV